MEPGCLLRAEISSDGDRAKREKSGEEKSKKTRTKRFRRADLMQQEAVARRVRLSLLPHL